MFEQIEEDEEEKTGKNYLPACNPSCRNTWNWRKNIFYPSMEQTEDSREKALEAYEEHNVAKMVLKECSSLDHRR